MLKLIVRRTARAFPSHLGYPPEIGYQIIEVCRNGAERVLYAVSGPNAVEYYSGRLLDIMSELNTSNVTFDGFAPGPEVGRQPIRGTIWERADFCELAARIAKERNDLARLDAMSKRRKEVMRALSIRTTGELN